MLPGRTAHAIRFKRARMAKRAPVKAVVQGGPAVEAPGVTEKEVHGDRMTLTVAGLVDEVRDLVDLVRVCRVDEQVWSISSYKQKAYQGYIKNARDKIEKTQLYSVTATMVRKVAESALRDELEYLVAEARERMPHVGPMVRVPEFEPGHLLVVNPTDLHMGKYAWGKESGHNYTVDIAEELLKEAVEDLLSKASAFHVSQIALVVGSDLLNADNSENMTTGGTPQTTDGRQQRTIRRTWRLMRLITERLLEVAPVHIVVVNGNHDRDMSFVIGEILSVAFAGRPDVTIDNGPPRRKYVKFGKCLIGYEHGDETKPAKLPGLMAEEAAREWGETLWRAFETGHLHDQAVIEYPGCIVRRNPALTAAEDWHHAKGFVGKIRTVHAQLWDPEDGNVAQFASSPVRPARAQVVTIGDAA